MSNPDAHSKWPTNYNLVIRDGKAVLDRDFFPTCCPSQLDDAWAARTVHFRPFFEQSAVTAGIVNRDHECGTNTPKNIALWKATAQKIILGKKYRDSMKSGWNKALENLTTKNQDSEAKGEGKHIVDFSFNNERPIAQEDVRNILFEEGVTSMVKEGRLEQPFALLFMWGYYLTMEGCSIDWATKATTDYIQDMKYNVVLGTECSGSKPQKTHGWNRIGTKVAVNSFQTLLRKQQKKVWGLVFETQVKLDEDADKDVDSEFEIVDIGEFLPDRVKTDMMRVSGTRFMVKRLSGKTLDANARLRIKMGDLYRWADEQGIERAEVMKVAREQEEGGTLYLPVLDTTVVHDNNTENYAGVAANVDTNNDSQKKKSGNNLTKDVSDSRINIGAMMAPQRKTIQPNEEKKKKKKDTKAKTKKGFDNFLQAQKKVSEHYYFLKTIQYS